MIDDLLCLLAFFGYRPSWYREWWTRPPFNRDESPVRYAASSTQ